jgi:hypothetical protein
MARSPRRPAPPRPAAQRSSAPRPSASAPRPLGSAPGYQCVLCTLQDANFLGYGCVLVDDCSATT